MNRRPVREDGPSKARSRSRNVRHWNRGQSLVEFSLILTPLLLILLGIVQFGLIFNAQVTITNAAREGARAATIYRFDDAKTKSQNDGLRDDATIAAITSSLGILSRNAPQFSGAGTWSSSGTSPNLTYTNGDIVVVYSVPTGVTDSDARAGEQIKVSITYHQDLVVPLIANLLPRDSNGRLAQGATVTMVIN